MNEIEVETPGSEQFWGRLFETSLTYEHPLNFWENGRYRSYTRAELMVGGRAVARNLIDRGVRRGDIAAVVLNNSAQAVSILMGCWFAGVTLASLPERAVGSDVGGYRDQIDAICAQLRPAAACCAADVLGDLGPEHVETIAFTSFDELLAGPAAPEVEARFLDYDHPIFIQYSSGSTGAPKGCVLSARAIDNHMYMLEDSSSGGRPGEIGVSWAPFSHDMGFFGGLMCGWRNDGTGYYSTPERFRMSPRTWLDDLARFGATYTSASPTALQVASKVMRLRKRGLPGSLDSLRCILIGAERVNWSVIEDALECLTPHGLRPEALMPAYGLAEGTLAVTVVSPDQRPTYVSVDAIALADGEVRIVPDDSASATRVVSCGVPIHGVKLEMEENSDALVPIKFRSLSAASGYHARDELTRVRFTADGLVDSGDLGFLRDGQLYPVGRADDMIPVGGRNVYVSAIEAEIESSIAAFRHGCTALIDATPDGSERHLVLLAEIGPKDSARAAIADEVAAICRRSGGLKIDEVAFIPRRTLPRTPSGKIQRHKCRLLVTGQGPASDIAIVESIRL
ncbi:AMP-binding protein [Nocardia tengchongensis]|uniref:AMP-binding protein n=1 Tax=Nocardia tengchongensis TaxID=2055889 RepID=UPI003681C9C2